MKLPLEHMLRKDSATASPVGGEVARRLPKSTLVKWLTASMYAAIIVPTLFFVCFAWYSYRQAFENASIEVDRANRMADQLLQNSLKANVAILGRLQALVGKNPDEALKLREKELHEHLLELATGRSDVQAIWIWGADGRAIATNRFYPVPQDTVITDRDYFRVHKDVDVGHYISDILFGRISNEHFFNISERRNHTDGSFGGIVSVSMYPSFFSTAYETMARDLKDLRITLARSDGKILARWPTLPPEQGPMTMSDMALDAISGEATTGQFSHLSNLDNEKRLVSFRKVGNWPLYVYAGLGHKTILAEWFRYMLTLAIFTFSVAIGLSYVSWVALRRTRQEQLTQADLLSESARRLKAEEALRQSQKLEALGQLTGGVAHDVNNLLMVIGTNAHVLRKLNPQITADNPQIAAIDRSVTSGAKLTRQLLSFSRQQKLAPERLNLQDELGGLLDLVRTSLGSAIGLRMEVALDTQPVCLDPVEFELALINLALNARDAMSKGEVLVSVGNGLPGEIPGRADRPVVVRFIDRGTGIAPQLVERVFEPFFTTKPPGKGTGLGLSQVYGFCAQAGGFARIESLPGRGTTVLMYFPPADATSTATPSIVSQQPADKLSGHVLLVEDNDDVGDSAVELLCSFGLSVERLATADAALDLIREHRARDLDLVLSDIFMPGKLSGIDLALVLQREFAQLPVVLMTGYAAQEHKAIEAGLKVLSKPFTPDVLIAALSQALKREQA